MTLSLILKDTNLNGVKILKTFGNYSAKKRPELPGLFYSHHCEKKIEENYNNQRIRGLSGFIVFNCWCEGLVDDCYFMYLIEIISSDIQKIYSGLQE